MNYISIPNIPENKVTLAIVDGRISTSLEKGLADNEIQIIKTKAHASLYASVAYHPDMFFHHLGGRAIIYAPGTCEDTIRELEGHGFDMIKGETELVSKYPGNISYNVARIGGHAFHNTRYTDKVLRDWLFKMDIELIHVNQGYAKCAISVVDSNSLITMDRGIAKIAERKGFDVLVIEEKNILLPGLDNGFIGGSSGLIDRSKWAVTGNFEELTSFGEINSFLSSKGIEIISLSNQQVTDIGSLIPIQVHQI
ncbi:DUF6873 family GME fold protein [Acetivibrio cellulolyticus]|uniref:DUF6873 family GME fold protein n=1 Tax=Acetivibrio cellulolyticus TaxID=35830 RepID=UPI0001E2D4E2|nr:hypothetical protein [Acetivibrio cellulolyticus]